MHLAVESVGTKRGGGWVILNEILSALSDDSRFTRITVFGSPQSIYAEARFLHPKIEWKKRTVADRFYAARMHWLTTGFNQACKEVHADCVLQMNAVGLCDLPTVSYSQQPLFFSSRAKATLSFSHRLRLKALEQLTKKSCEHSDRVFVQTHWMQKAMNQRWNVFPQVVRSPPPNIERMFVAKGQNGLLWIGSELDYKRRHFFERLERELSDETDFLTLCSSNAAMSREEILAVLKRSSILVITSLTESLGLPLIEGMAKGTMIIAPDLPYAQETCEDAAMYYETRSYSSLLSAVRAALDNETLRRRHIQAGTRRALVLDAESENYLALRDGLFDVSQ